MNKLKNAFILNIIIVILEIIANAWMMSGIKIASDNSTLMATRLESFKYFTIDSNVLMGVIALIALIDIGLVTKGKKKEISNITNVLLLTGTTSVALTMLVTLFFLAPTMGLGIVFLESNFLLHVVNPVVSIVAFVCFEKTKNLNFKHTFTATLPLFLYSIYYVEEVLRNTTNGIIGDGYDWYGFFFLGVKSVIIILPIIYVVTYGISFELWKLNKAK